MAGRGKTIALSLAAGALATVTGAGSPFEVVELPAAARPLEWAVLKMDWAAAPVLIGCPGNAGEPEAWLPAQILEFISARHDSISPISRRWSQSARPRIACRFHRARAWEILEALQGDETLELDRRGSAVAPSTAAFGLVVLATNGIAGRDRSADRGYPRRPAGALERPESLTQSPGSR